MWTMRSHRHMSIEADDTHPYRLRFGTIYSLPKKKNGKVGFRLNENDDGRSIDIIEIQGMLVKKSTIRDGDFCSAMIPLGH